MITCAKCGKENQDHYKFCLGCGAELPREAAAKKFPVGTPPQGVQAGRVPGQDGGGFAPRPVAQDAGFASAVTTRPGMIFREHAAYLTALPRLSVNGNHQNLAALDVLLSGAPFMLLNRGRKLSVA